MPPTFSEVVADWKGFERVPYQLGDRALRLPLTRFDLNSEPIAQSASGKQMNPLEARMSESKVEDITLMELRRELDGHPIRKVESELQGTVLITTDAGVIGLGAASENSFAGHMDSMVFDLDIALTYIKMLQEGIDLFESSLFYYEKDPKDDGMADSYSFFVVYNNEIVRERLAFTDRAGNQFDPRVFEANGSSTRWRNNRSSRDAWALYWYRQFYSSTRTGQILALSAETPEAFRASDVPVASSVRKSRSRTFWTVFALVLLTLPPLWAIAFPPSRWYMVAADIILALGLIGSQRKSRESKKKT